MEVERQSKQDGWREWECDILLRVESREAPEPGQSLGKLKVEFQPRKVRVCVNLKEAARTMGARALRSKGGKCVDGFLVVKAYR